MSRLASPICEPPRARPAVRRGVTWLLGAIVALASCGDPRDLIGKRLRQVEISPSALLLRPGERQKLSLLARYSDGSVEAVSTSVAWGSTAGTVATIDGATGQVSAHRPGLVSLSARIGKVEGHALALVTEKPYPAGALRRDPATRRYFVDRNGQAVYLTGSHTWLNFQDHAPTHPPPTFDYDAYLDFLQSHGHNFFRLWRSEQANWLAQRKGNFWTEPLPYRRTGPGSALDGRLRFDLTAFNPEYFDRLRRRVHEASKRGIYVSVMLFNGWCVEPKGDERENPWRGHPFHRANNINGVDGDPDADDRGVETHRLGLPSVLDHQEAYVRRIVQTLNDLDNVLYEISNESTAGSMPWQIHWTTFIRRLERDMPTQHPVGITVERPGESNDAVFGSGADWVSPFRHHAKPLEPFAWHGEQVVLNDTDHLCGVCGSPAWVWKSLTRGQNPVLMDPYDVASSSLADAAGRLQEEDWGLIRRSMGWARVLAEWIDPKTAQPYGGVISSGYGLASGGDEQRKYIIYTDGRRKVSLFAGSPRGRFAVRWLDVATGRLIEAAPVEAAGSLELESPVGDDAVLLLESVAAPR